MQYPSAGPHPLVPFLTIRLHLVNLDLDLDVGISLGGCGTLPIHLDARGKAVTLDSICSQHFRLLEVPDWILLTVPSNGCGQANSSYPLSQIQDTSTAAEGTPEALINDMVLYTAVHVIGT